MPCIQGIRCLLGAHDLALVATDSSCKWTSNGRVTDHILLSFYQCRACGKRTTDKMSWMDKQHESAVSKVRRWVKAGHLASTAIRQCDPADLMSRKEAENLLARVAQR